MAGTTTRSARARREAVPARPAPARRRPARRRPARAARFLPSLRSLLAGLLLLGFGGGAYVAAARTSLFALRTVEVRGAQEPIAAHVREALAPLEGTPLPTLAAGEVAARVAALPEVVSARVDRAFPHTLRVVVRPERPVAILRRGRESWLVSARGRVLRELRTPRRSSLPRVWIGRDAAVQLGALLPPGAGGRAARALAPLAEARFPAEVRTASAGPDTLDLVLRSGVTVRLGNPRELRLKLAIARRILLLGGEYAYVDVSVPERPVARLKSQVAG